MVHTQYRVQTVKMHMHSSKVNPTTTVKHQLVQLKERISHRKLYVCSTYNGCPRSRALQLIKDMYIHTYTMSIQRFHESLLCTNYALRQQVDNVSSHCQSNPFQSYPFQSNLFQSNPFQGYQVRRRNWDRKPNFRCYH